MYSDGHSEEDLSIMPIEEITASDKGTCAKRLEREDYCIGVESCAPFTLMQTCQPSRIFRDNPGYLTTLPESRDTVA